MRKSSKKSELKHSPCKFLVVECIIAAYDDIKDKIHVQLNASKDNYWIEVWELNSHASLRQWCTHKENDECNHSNYKQGQCNNPPAWIYLFEIQICKIFCSLWKLSKIHLNWFWCLSVSNANLWFWLLVACVSHKRP